MRARVSIRRNVTSILKRSAFCVPFVFSVAIQRSGSYFSCKCKYVRYLHPGGGSVSESNERPTASESDRTGRNPGMTRLVRHSMAPCPEVLRFSLLFKHSVSARVNFLALRYVP